MKRIACLIGAAYFLSSAAAAESLRVTEPLSITEQDWEFVAKKNGIVVSQRLHPDGFPIFRGVTTLDASPCALLAVMHDVPRHTEWMERCAESKTLKVESKYRRIVYNRTDLPWPAADRDTVTRSIVRVIKTASTIDLEFKAIPDVLDPIEDVVRMPRLEGRYQLRSTDRGTEVTYQVAAHPGGRIPGWLVNQIVRSMPIKTLSRLPEQEAKHHETYQSFREECQAWPATK